MALDLSDKKILIVDDFREMRMAIKRTLEAFLARDMHEARDGAEAVNMLSRHTYHIVLCDYNLGDGRDGQQVLEEAKHRELLPHSAVFLMITAENTADMVMGAMEYYPDGYLVKPVTKPVLQARLAKLLEKKSSLAFIEKVLRKKDYVAALALCDEHLEKERKNRLELLKLKGELCLKVGDYESAGTVYNSILAERDIPWALLGLGKTCFHSEDLHQAKEIFQRLLEQNEALVEGYDWLAKTFDHLGDTEEAQKVLMRAAKLSPKAILRQKALGEIACKNADYDVAHAAYKKAVQIGKTSCFKSPTDYTGLASVLAKTGAPEKALRVIADAKREFEEGAVARLQVALAEGLVKRQMGRMEEAQQAITEAAQQFSHVADQIPPEVAMDLAKACFETGIKGDGEGIIRHVIRDNHEREDILASARCLFADAGMSENGEALITKAREEVFNINNRGVQLAGEGKMAEASKFFAQAADSMPGNPVVNLNAARSLIFQMKKNGKTDWQMYQARQYLDRVRRLNASDEKYQKLLASYKALAGEQNTVGET